MTDEPKKPKEERGDWGSGCVRERPGKHAGKVKTFELRWSMGRNAAGKRIVQTKTFRGTETQANAAMGDILSNIRKGQHVAPTRQTVAQYIERWLTYKAKADVTGKTIERYASLLRHHVAGHIGGTAIQKLSPTDLKTLYAELLTNGREDGAGLSPQSVRHVHRAVCTMLKDAVLEGVLPNNPASSVKAPKVERRDVEILGPDQVKAVMEKLTGHIRPIALLALGTGLRRGELCALRWCDLDLVAGTVTVGRSVEQTNKAVRIKPPKTRHGRRTVSVPAFALTELRTHRKALVEARLAAGIGKMPDDALVFGGIANEIPRPDSVSKQWAKAADDLGMGGVVMHALRHTFASLMIKSGLDVLTVSRQLGHGKVSMTLDVYSHCFGKNEDETTRRINAAFSAIGAKQEPSAN